MYNGREPPSSPSWYKQAIGREQRQTATESYPNVIENVNESDIEDEHTDNDKSKQLRRSTRTPALYEASI